VVSLHLQADFIDTFIDQVSGEAGVNIYVMDTNGVILAESVKDSDWVYRAAQELIPEVAARYTTDDSFEAPEYAPALGPLLQAVEMAFRTGTTGRFQFCHPHDLAAVPREDCADGERSQVVYEIVPDPIHQTPLFLVLVEVMEGPYQDAARQQAVFSVLIALVLGVVLVAASVVVARSMASPIQRMAEAAERVEAEEVFEPESLDDIAGQGDELGMLARVFSKMVIAVQKRERALKREVHRLRIQIDEKKKQEEVDQIANQEFFQDLQKKAKGFRRNRKDSDDEETGEEG
jgi:methyl-accepting chemotaxis protein